MHRSKRILRLGLLLCLSATPRSLHAQPASPAEEFSLPDDLEVRVWAQTPQLFNPTNIDIDAAGRVWVAEGVNYRETIKPHEALKHPDGDRIMILADTDGDGFCDSSKVFVEDKDLICPLGIGVFGEKIVVSCSPHVIIYTDSNGDDKPDKKEIFLTGFGGRDHDHGVHAFIGGPDGRWYFNAGNAGPHEVTDKSGFHLSCGSNYKYESNSNTGNRRSSDGRVWVGGIALRIDPDGKHLTPLAHNFRNSYEMAIDSFGNLFQTDNDDDGNQACRFAWVMEGANFGYASADGTRSWKSDQRPGQPIPRAHWHQDDPGVMPAGDILGAGGPTGIVVCESDALADRYRGAVFSCDAGRNCVYSHTIEPDGAGYKLKRDILIASKKAPKQSDEKSDESRDNWFRPSDVAIGTDGAVYISDWYDPMVGGHDIKEKDGQGRILRVARRGTFPRPVRLEMNTLEQQLAVLASPAINVRFQATAKLRERADAALPRLTRILEERGFSRRRARAVWLVAQMGNAGIAAVEDVLNDPDEDIRITALRALRQANHRVVEHLTHLAADNSPAVRREVAIALRDVPLDQARPILLKLGEQVDGNDRVALEAFGIGCDGKEDAVYLGLIDRLNARDPLGWSENMAAIAWRLHPPAAIDALATRARAFSLTPQQREQAVAALAFMNDPRAAETMVLLSNFAPDDVRSSAKWWLRQRADNDWSDFSSVKPFATTQPNTDALKRLDADKKTMLDNEASQRQRMKAAERLATDQDGGMFIISLAADGKFPKELTEAVAEPIYHNPDFGVRALASEYFPRQLAGGAKIPPMDDLVKLPGDAGRGRDVFFSATAGCARCHAFAREGRDVGPDLTSIRTKYKRRELLDAILNPSAAILMGYEPWIIKTRAGAVYSGFILADAENVVIKESSGEKITIPAADIVLRKKQNISVMPNNVALGLSAQELANLAEFLLNSPVP